MINNFNPTIALVKVGENFELPGQVAPCIP